MAAKAEGVHLARLIAGWPALDLANTVQARFPRRGEQPPDYLDGYQDLVRWSRRAGAVGAADEGALLAAAKERPDECDAALVSARALRETIYRVFSALAGGSWVDQGDLGSLQEWYSAAVARAVLAPHDGRLRWSWEHRTTEPDCMLWPLAMSAVELGTGDALARLKQCPGHDGRCGWLFLDATKNASRRWCSMQDCGNPAKARRQSERRRAARRREG